MWDGPRDERLLCPGLLGAVWHPLLEVGNARLLSRQLQVTGILPTGEPAVLTRLQGKLASALNLRDFPFDEQDLPIIAEALEPASEVELSDYPEHTGVTNSCPCRAGTP